MEFLYNKCGVLFWLSIKSLYRERLYNDCDVLFEMSMLAYHMEILDNEYGLISGLLL